MSASTGSPGRPRRPRCRPGAPRACPPTGTSGRASTGRPRVPIEGATFPGTVADLDDPSAGGADPLLSTPAAGLRVTGLRAAPADPAAELTVFAPTDATFEAIPVETVPRWLAADVLDDVLSRHVVTTRYDADALAAAEAVETLGGPLVVSGDQASLVVGERGSVGNIATTNGTVFVVDDVLRPEGAG